VVVVLAAARLGFLAMTLGNPGDDSAPLGAVSTTSAPRATGLGAGAPLSGIPPTTTTTPAPVTVATATPPPTLSAMVPELGVEVMSIA
jgi:hypothetical protein